MRLIVTIIDLIIIRGKILTVGIDHGDNNFRNINDNRNRNFSNVRNNNNYNNNNYRNDQYNSSNYQNYNYRYNKSNRNFHHNNHQSYNNNYGRNNACYEGNNRWHNNDNQRKQIEYDDRNRWKDFNQRKQIQYDNQNFYYINNCNMNIEEIGENKVDTAKDNNEIDFNINNLAENTDKGDGSAFMTTLKLNNNTTNMQVDTGSKYTIIPHDMAKKIGIREMKKSRNFDTNYEDEINKLIKDCESKLTSEPINKIDLVGEELKRWIHEKIIEPVNDVRWASPITAVFERILSNGLVPNFAKSLFFKNKVRFLGHDIDDKGKINLKENDTMFQVYTEKGITRKHLDQLRKRECYNTFAYHDYPKKDGSEDKNIKTNDKNIVIPPRPI
ncbi:TBC1 domain family member 5 homolog A-like [Gordionus sp. m RMFG-2023]|uniref:TBC1 domain family member 5 homolog A-like n=1 Tax=Gordionus sp. m RMFG-2023 TaxID=3053472 RepID=UPI0031FC188F